MNSMKVGLVTLHTGYNYGTLLQAYAMNKLIVECGYEPFMLWHRDGIVKGRDVTISKLRHSIFLQDIETAKKSY